MKIAFLVFTILSTLMGQTPSASDDTVVVTIDGRDVTAGEIRKILEGGSPQFLRAYQEDAINALQQFFELRELAAVEAARNGVTRTEPEAHTFALDLLNRLKGGADFGKLAAQYSDDAALKSKGGDFPPVSQTENVPVELKTAVIAMSPGELSGPIRSARGLYILRIEGKSTPQVGEVSETIVLALRQAPRNEWLQSLNARYAPVVKRPDFFTQRP